MEDNKILVPMTLDEYLEFKKIKHKPSLKEAIIKMMNEYREDFEIRNAYSAISYINSMVYKYSIENISIEIFVRE